MLQSKKYEKDSVVSFKLVNGDEIVARVIEDQEHHFVINKPCTIMPSAKGLGLIQSLFTSDINHNISLNKSHVMLDSPTIKDVVNHYIETTTGIQPVDAGGIIT